MERNEIILRGSLPEWSESFSGSGYGSGYGAGYGDGSGYGDGYGAGDGDGYGAGDGSGYGDGYGAGDGYGYGAGDGYGAGAGYGDGSGYGDGYGAGDGDGYGDGSGYGDGYWTAVFKSLTAVWPSRQISRLQEVLPSASAIALWKSDVNGCASNGGNSKEPARPGLIEEIRGPLKICTVKGLHATMKPEGYTGERIWVVALFGEVQWQGDKCAALKREILGELELFK